MEPIYIDIEKDIDDIFTIECDPHKSIKDLKKRIKKAYKIPEYCQKLYFNEIELSDDNQFSDYSIKATDAKNYEGRSRLFLLNLNELKVLINIKNKKFKYYLKASDSIFNLKENIFKKLYIPVDKIKIVNSKKIIDDNQLIEDFLLNLHFDIILSEIEKIKINIINENNIETIAIDPFSYTDDIYKILNKNYLFRLKFKDKFIHNGKLIIQYNIKNGDNIELIKNELNKIKLRVKRSTRDCETVIVYPDEPLYVLMDMLNILDESTKFAYKGRTYNLASILTFEKIGLIKDTSIVIFNQAVSGCN